MGEISKTKTHIYDAYSMDNTFIEKTLNFWLETTFIAWTLHLW